LFFFKNKEAALEIKGFEINGVIQSTKIMLTAKEEVVDHVKEAVVVYNACITLTVI
jgi:hypothetical protein